MRVSATKSVILAGAAGIVLGGGATLLLVGGGRARPVTAVTEAEPARAGSADQPSGLAKNAFGAAALRAAVREEVHAAIREATATSANGHLRPEDAGQPEGEGKTKETAAPTPNFEIARSHVAERLTQGSWSERDRDRMRDLFGEMHDFERKELMKQLIVAVNRGKIRVDLRGPLF